VHDETTAEDGAKLQNKNVEDDVINSKNSNEMAVGGGSARASPKLHAIEHTATVITIGEDKDDSSSESDSDVQIIREIPASRTGEISPTQGRQEEEGSALMFTASEAADAASNKTKATLVQPQTNKTSSRASNTSASKKGEMSSAMQNATSNARASTREAPPTPAPEPKLGAKGGVQTRTQQTPAKASEVLNTKQNTRTREGSPTPSRVTPEEKADANVAAQNLHNVQHNLQRMRELAASASDKAADAPGALPRPSAQVQAEAENAELKQRIEKQKQQISKLEREVVDKLRDVDELNSTANDLCGTNTGLRAALKMHQEETRGLVLPTKFTLLNDPEYAERFQQLVQRGATLEEAHEALEATLEGGVYSVKRADAYLKKKTSESLQAAVAKAKEEAGQLAGDDVDKISEDSACGRLLAQHPDSADIVLRLRDVHSKKIRGSHTVIPAVCCANIARLPSVAFDQQLNRKGSNFLCQAALAVAIDCSECQKLRETSQEQERKKLEATKAKALAAEETKKKQTASREAAEKKAAEAKRKRENAPVVLNFNPKDSKRDVTLPRGFCANSKCGLGQDPVAGKYLYHCQNSRCLRGYHLHCSELVLVRIGREEKFHCRQCMDETERKQRDGESVPEHTVLGSDISHGKAPPSTEAAGPSMEDEQKAFFQNAATAALATVQSMYTPRNAPPASAVTSPPPQGLGQTPLGAPDTPSALGRTQSGAVDPSRELNFGSNFSRDSSGAKPTVQVKDYTVWDAVPREWKPKEGQSLEHPEKGYGKAAYQRWRRLNTTARDAVQAGGSTLGPLTRGISSEMRIVLGTQLMLEPALKAFWPSAELTDSAIDAWVRQDPAFKWFEQISDQTLLDLLDKRFGVQKPDLFLSKRFPADMPALTATGEVNYHGAEFLRWSSDWQAELGELQRSNCNLDGVDLRQALLNALSTNAMLYNKASILQSRSPYVLLSNLRDWVLKEEEAQQALRNQKAILLPPTLKTHGATGDVLQGGNPGLILPPAQHAAGGAQKHQQAMALLTQLQELVQMPQPGNPGFAKRPLTEHLKPHGSNDEGAKCNGCGNVWPRNRNIPCYHACKFAEHPEYNREIKKKTYPAERLALTWKDFRSRFPSVQPPASFLKWEERDKAFNAGKPKKRNREERDQGGKATPA
jgi:septum formation inhibitor MinC